MSDERTTPKSNIIILDSYRPAIDGQASGNALPIPPDDAFPLREDLTPEENLTIIELMAELEASEEGYEDESSPKDVDSPSKPDPRKSS